MTPIPEFLIEIPEPTIAVIVSTYSSLPYITLQLEAWKRFWPTLPLLVHDDSSPEKEALAAVCQEYGAEFLSTDSRRGHGSGDMAAIVSGLDWAHKKNADLLLKVSRRYLIYHDFVPALQELVYNTQYTVYTNSCCDYNLRFRSECAAFHVETWRNSDVAEEMRAALLAKRDPSGKMERWYHDAAKRIHQQSAPMSLRRREKVFPRHLASDSYGTWHMMGQGRQARVPGVLWHDANFPEEYYRLAQEWDLTQFTLSHFRQPNTLSPINQPAIPTSSDTHQEQKPAKALPTTASNAEIVNHLQPLDFQKAQDAAKGRFTDYTWLFTIIRNPNTRFLGQLLGVIFWGTSRTLSRLAGRRSFYISLLNFRGEAWLADIFSKETVREGAMVRHWIGVNRFVWTRLEKKMRPCLPLERPQQCW